MEVKAVKANNPTGYAEALEADPSLEREVERLLDYNTEDTEE